MDHCRLYIWHLLQLDGILSGCPDLQVLNANRHILVTGRKIRKDYWCGKRSSFTAHHWFHSLWLWHGSGNDGHHMVQGSHTTDHMMAIIAMVSFLRWSRSKFSREKHWRPKSWAKYVWHSSVSTQPIETVTSCKPELVASIVEKSEIQMDKEFLEDGWCSWRPFSDVGTRGSLCCPAAPVCHKLHIKLLLECAIRYPELVEQTSAGWRFGRFVSQEEPLRGGFLPVFWDVPRARTLSLDKEFLDSNQPSDFTGTFVSQKFRWSHLSRHPAHLEAAWPVFQKHDFMHLRPVAEARNIDRQKDSHSIQLYGSPCHPLLH